MLHIIWWFGIEWWKVANNHSNGFFFLFQY